MALKCFNCGRDILRSPDFGFDGVKAKRAGR
jgi:hypothetical protein